MRHLPALLIAIGMAGAIGAAVAGHSNLLALIAVTAGALLTLTKEQTNA